MKSEKMACYVEREICSFIISRAMEVREISVVKICFPTRVGKLNEFVTAVCQDNSILIEVS